MTETQLRSARTRRAPKALVDSLARIVDGFVPTPPAVAERLAESMRDLSVLHDGAQVLEPSAGNGVLVREVLSRNKQVHVHAVEPSPARCDELDALAAEHPGQVTVYRMTFEDFAATWSGPLFDAVIMNPPFNNYTENGIWMDHVRLAHGLLHHGAQLAAIVPNSYGYRGDKTHAGFRAWAEGNGARFTQLPAAAFKGSGTTPQTGMLTVCKPMPARASGRPLWLIEDLPAGPPAASFTFPHVTQAAVYPVHGVRSVGYQKDRVIRFAGCCFGCGRTQWAHDGGRDEALPWAACSTLDPTTYDKTGPEALICINCCDAVTWEALMAAVAPYWTDGPAEPGPNIYPEDLTSGVVATVTGHDVVTRELVTVTGRLTADPEHTEHTHRGYSVSVQMRPLSGGAVVLHADPSSRVQCHEAPCEEEPGTVRVPAPRPAEPAQPAPSIPAPRPATPAEDSTELDPWADLAVLTLPGL